MQYSSGRGSMSKIQSDKVKVNGNKNVKPKLIFVGENKLQLKRVEKLAKENNFEFLSYSDGEWATLEEIDQYIQEEELSKQVVNLPVGKKAVSSLDELEAETIKQVIKNLDGNMIKAARTLKIARATLYRKIERYGWNLKKQREEQFGKQEKSLKKSA